MVDCGCLISAAQAALTERTVAMLKIYYKDGKNWSVATFPAASALLDWFQGADIHPGSPAFLISGDDEYDPQKFEQSGSAQTFGDVKKYVLDCLSKTIPSLHP